MTNDKSEAPLKLVFVNHRAAITLMWPMRALPRILGGSAQTPSAICEVITTPSLHSTQLFPAPACSHNYCRLNGQAGGAVYLFLRGLCAR